MFDQDNFTVENVCMSDSIPLATPTTATPTADAGVPVYRYLMRQPDHWLRQAFFVGRPKLPVSRVVETMQANGQSVEESARDWGLPVAAIEEALDYCQRFRDLLVADAADELALSEELAQRSPLAP
jgi:uncharacterized protein (DUF433 family)